MWNALQRILPKCGINRQIPRSILYGSSSRQGLGVKDLHLLQGIHHITDIVDHTYKKSITGHLIQDSLEHLKLELGINGLIAISHLKSSSSQLRLVNPTYNPKFSLSSSTFIMDLLPS
mmetsp:Transcript_13025/g.15888  ORF Transcript_13025/g.15888 Transcript_13025/m.15888 type:complete len:118 (+) Transcript_13025:156-509(+)